MQQNNTLDVFDFDGTLIRANSFSVICKKMLSSCLNKGSFINVLTILLLYIARRAGYFNHIDFKNKMMLFMSKYFSEKEQQEMIQDIFIKNSNKDILEKLYSATNPIVSTAAPYIYMSKLVFKKPITVISSLSPEDYIVDRTNQGLGKVKNLMSYFKSNELCILNFYTDDLSEYEDAAVAKCARTTYIVKNGRIVNTISNDL